MHWTENPKKRGSCRRIVTAVLAVAGDSIRWNELQ